MQYAQGIAIHAAEERHAKILEHLAASAVAMHVELTGESASKHPAVSGGREHLLQTLSKAIDAAESRLRVQQA